ncbi:nucleic acid binding OB-fold tRNA/helicase-type [Halorhabdus utahensis DSM 12940]|uniref:Nucleic acid binding OB-fold tRNA/helicase-type n=1 Tax=Halorhabdus utahensis (strain DSM 12940 / JCM 11049 / AX-2) TaxID=519442 RepID=C7NSS0_HALUD|nr:Single-stranded DNA binding protein [Halorhabdus utahensis]ACV10731.1 nucleic acid binding OB-fold tRNA/helicase-type [Halorhabdus utahensis DSM 12940]
MSVEDKAEELASDLGVDKAEVKEDLQNLVSYSVPLEEAVQSLRRKYGDTDDSGGSIPEADVAEVSTGDDAVSVTGVFLTVGTRSIRYQGSDHVIHEGEFADETGKISYTAWEDFGVEPGDVVRIENAGVREWDGEPELNLGERTTVRLSDDAIDVPYDIGGDRRLAALAPGDRGVNAEVQVLEREQKIIDGRDGETEILSGVLADETARLPFTDWDPHAGIEEGASIRIEDAFVREFRGAPAINVSEFSTVTALDRTVEATDDAPRMAIREAVEGGGLFDVEVTGTAIAVRDGSGLIERCPECGRVVQNGQCRSHGAVEGEDDLRTKAILDDGTGTVTAVLDEELTAEVYGGGLEDARDHARDAMDRDVVTDAIREAIVGRAFRVRGSLSVDDFGATLNATEFESRRDDPAARAREVLAEVEP